MKTTVTVLRCGFANAYLLRGQGGSVLVDTGTARYRQLVLEACRAARVRLILLTHGHCDHCQNAAFLSGELGCPVGISREDADLLAQGERRRVYGRGLWGRLYAAASNHTIQTQEITPVHPHVFLTEGMDLAPYGVAGRVVALPGHTAGSMGVLLADGALLAGDAAQGLGPVTGPWCWEDFTAAQASMQRLKRLAKKRPRCGHGF